MFKQLMDILRKGDLVEQAVAETDLMFENAKKVFQESVATLEEKRPPSFDIYKLDRKINNSEKDIRRKLLENMAINPRQDIVASLVLTSIIIDIERIGDYSKNIYELEQLSKDKSKLKIDTELLEKSHFFLTQFDAIRQALSEDDEQMGKDIMDKLDPVRKSFDQYLCDVVVEPDIKVDEAVINALFARYLKRVAAHLENIASGIANPFHRIGFYKKQEIE